MKQIFILLLILSNSIPAFSGEEKALKTLFPDNTANKCSHKLFVDQKVDDLKKTRILAFINCDKSGEQEASVQLAEYEEDQYKILAKGSVLKNKDNEVSLQEILLKPEDAKISDKDRVFQMRLQYKPKKNGTLQEELVVLHESDKEISDVLRGPLEDFPGRGRAFLIITKLKTNGFADLALKSEHKTEAFRWRGTTYKAFTREEGEQLKK